MPDYVVLLIAIIMLLSPLELARPYFAMRRRTSHAVGRIKDVSVEISPRFTVGETSIPTNHPVVEFEVNGEKYSFVSSIGNSWSTPTSGNEIYVVYEPLNPHNAEVEASQMTKFLGWTLPFFGVPFIGFCILLYWLTL